MIHKFSLCAVLAMASAGALAQQADCKKFADAIEADQKQLSLGAASGGAGVAAAAAGSIQANLMLMQAAKCKLPTEPISASYYRMSAAVCNSRMRGGYTAPSEAVDACDTRKWERDK